jgi:hypothetical protein
VPLLHIYGFTTVGNYIAVWVSASGCLDTIAINLISGARVSVSSDTVCVGMSANLTAIATPSGGHYKWNTGDTTQSITIAPAANATYYVNYSQGQCAATSTQASIVVLPQSIN